MLTNGIEVWALYKEVASYYDAGLDPPEDVTLLFPDDNWGNVYRLPTGDEVSRKGGSGVSKPPSRRVFCCLLEALTTP